MEQYGYCAEWRPDPIPLIINLQYMWKEEGGDRSVETHLAALVAGIVHSSLDVKALVFSISAYPGKPSTFVRDTRSFHQKRNASADMLLLDDVNWAY